MGYHYIIYADEEKKYPIWLHLCRTQRAYDKKREAYGFLTLNSTAAFCGNWLTGKYDEKKRPMGMLLINLVASKRILQNVVAHESVHAAMHFLRRLKLLKKLGMNVTGKKRTALQNKDPEKIPEERLCYCVGRLVDQINRYIRIDRKYKS